MKTIWKFPLTIDDEQVVEMPRSSVPLSVALQDGTVCLWAEVITEFPLRKAHISIRGTGHAVPDEYERFMGSVQQGPFVWHIFWRGWAL